jgi:hypothetical protein
VLHPPLLSGGKLFAIIHAIQVASTLEILISETLGRRLAVRMGFKIDALLSLRSEYALARLSALAVCIVLHAASEDAGG